jgi:GTP:adenosylcobinamide-phosphate guanylyltransferase
MTQITVILLAAQRAGVVNPLAARAGVSHKCLVPICGRPLIEHVLDTLTSVPQVGEIRVSLEPEAHGEARSIAARFADRGVKIIFLPSDSNIAESVINAVGDSEGPFVITTADNVLLTAEGFAQVQAALARHDAVIAVARRESVLAAHPEGQRNFYKLRGAEFANCNIYGLASRRALAAVEFFREGGQFQKNRGRLLRAVGLVNVALFLARLVTIETGFRRVGKRFGVDAGVVTFADGSLAIDVDNERTYACCETILQKRAAGVATPSR